MSTEKINRRIKSSFTYIPETSYGVKQESKKVLMIEIPKTKKMSKDKNIEGNSLDYCLLVKAETIKANVCTASACTLTFCLDENKSEHFVMVIDNDVMDIRQGKITTIAALQKAGYSKFAQPDGAIDAPWKYIYKR